MADVCCERLAAALQPLQNFLELQQSTRAKFALVDGEKFTRIWRSPSGEGSEEGGFSFDVEKIPGMAQVASRVLCCSPCDRGIPSRWCVSNREAAPICFLRGGFAMSGDRPLSEEAVREMWNASDDSIFRQLSGTPVHQPLSVGLYHAGGNSTGMRIQSARRFSTWEKGANAPVDVYIGGNAVGAHASDSGAAQHGIPTVLADADKNSVAGVASEFGGEIELLNGPLESVKALTCLTSMIDGSPQRCGCLTRADLFFFARQVCIGWGWGGVLFVTSLTARHT